MIVIILILTIFNFMFNMLQFCMYKNQIKAFVMSSMVNKAIVKVGMKK